MKKNVVVYQHLWKPLALVGLFLGIWLVLPTQAQVVINEVLVVNKDALFPDVTDDTYTPSYVELYNTSDTAIDLGNYYGRPWSISDSTNSPPSFWFVTGTIIPAHGFLLLYLDNRTNATIPPGIHVGNQLRDSGDDFNLYFNYDYFFNPNPVDRVFFGMQLSDVSLSRVTDGIGAFNLQTPTPGLSNNGKPVLPSITSTNLRINEWMSDPISGDDWFEIYNPETDIVNIAECSFRDDKVPAVPRRLPPFSFINAGGFLVFIADSLGGTGKPNANKYDHVDFALGRTGDQIWMLAGDLATIIDKVDTGVLGLNQTSGRLPDGSTNIVRPLGLATPNESNFQLIPNVVINEVLPHTDSPFEDAIEFYNPTGTDFPIGNFWLSNSETDAKKYRIPAGTTVPAYGYKVFYEYVGGAAGSGFNTDGTGTNRMFTLNSARGDQVYLYSADAAGNLMGGRLSKSFEASARAVSFGRYTNSQGNVHFVPMSQRTFGQDNPPDIPTFRLGTGRPNAYPRIGPLVINELMYHPPDIITNDIWGTIIKLDDSLSEYIEIYNVTTTNVLLYDPDNYGYADGRTNTWRLRGQVDYDFPVNVALGPGAYLLLVTFNPTDAAQSNAFCLKYNVPAGTRLFGPYSGKLSNSGGSIELYKPDPPQAPDRPNPGLVPKILVDEIDYLDGFPWPASADGEGQALQRIKPEEYANDPLNWRSTQPSPGRHEAFSIASARREGSSDVVSFPGQANSTYTLQYKTGLTPPGGWSNVTSVAAQPTTGMRYVTNSGISGTSGRFYRVVTPAQ